MLEVLTMDISELRNGVNSTYHLSFQKSGNSPSRGLADSIIDLLRLECIKRGLTLNIGGKTSESSKTDGSSQA